MRIHCSAISQYIQGGGGAPSLGEIIPTSVSSGERGAICSVPQSMQPTFQSPGCRAACQGGRPSGNLAAMRLGSDFPHGEKGQGTSDELRCSIQDFAGLCHSQGDTVSATVHHHCEGFIRAGTTSSRVSQDFQLRVKNQSVCFVCV